MRFAGRKTATTLALALTSAAGVALTAVPADAKPDLETVQKQVERLQHQAEVATERYDEARNAAVAIKDRLDGLNDDLRRQSAVVEGMRRTVATSVVDQFQGNALSTPAQAVLSQNPQAFLDNLNSLSAYNNTRGRMIADYQVQLDRLNLRKAAVKDEAKKLDGLERSMLKSKKEIEAKEGKAKKVLDSLEADARAKILAGDWTGPLPKLNASGRVSAAIDYAMSKVGDAYVWGASGPSAFDCSGLMMAAFARAGISLPHSSRAQSGMGIPVSESELQPGDLVFFYSPVSHVGMYIGNGLMVNAENPSVGVKVTSLHTMPFVSARRVG